MTKKRKMLWMGGAALVVLLACAWLWYGRALTLEALCPGVSLSECQGITIRYQTAGGPYVDDVVVELGPEDAGFDVILASVEGRVFRRSALRGLLERSGSLVHTWAEDDFWWRLTLTFPENGEGARRQMTLYNFFGSLSLIGDGETVPVRTAGQEEWARLVLEIAQGAGG